MDPILQTPKRDFSQFVIRAPKAEEGGTMPPTPPQPIQAPPVPPVANKRDLSQFVIRKAAPPEPAPVSGKLTVEDVKNDSVRLDKIRTMMSATKDVYYEEAPPEELMKDFMAHMRFLNVNELSVAAEALNVMSADEALLSKYGDAYKVYDEMGSMFSNGDGWNGTLDYAQAMVTSPSLYLGLGIGKIAGNAGSRAAAAKLTNTAIGAAARAAAKKSGGAVAESLVTQQLRNYSSKVAARYAIIGAVATEAPFQTLTDYLYQDIRMKVDVQDEYSILQGAIATLGGAAGGVIPAAVLLRSSNSLLSNTGELVTAAAKERARTAAGRAAPEVAEALKRLSSDWTKLADAGKGMPENPALERSVTSWFFDYKQEDGLVSILQRAGVNISPDEANLSNAMIEFAMGMGDDALASFNKALEPVGLTFGEATNLVAKSMKGAGETFKPASDARKFFNNYQNLTVGKKTSRDSVVEELDEAADAALKERDIAGYVLSTWKKSLVSTYPTTAMNVMGWGLARAAGSISDVMLAGGYLGKAGMRAVINPAGAVQDLAKMRSLMANQAFALNTLLDPFLSAEAFLTLLEKSAPTKIKKSVTGQIFGGIDSRGPKRFGLDPEGSVTGKVEATTDFFQRVSFVRLQDTLTKGISGLTALDKQSRLGFGKGIEQLIKDGEIYKLTDEMWEDAMKPILRETFSEDVSKGKNVLSVIAKTIESVSNNPILGYVIPFGKFMNNAMAFTLRHSPLGYYPAIAKVFGRGASEPIEESVARATVGSMAFGYMMARESEKQEEGLQWFERRTANGSIENITNLFPYSLYALVGRISTNVWRGEGMSKDLMADLRKQIGPMDALEDLSTPAWYKDIVKFLADDRVEDEEKNSFLVFTRLMMSSAGELAAGFTRPLDIYSRVLSHSTDEAGGGLAIDRKQARGIDNVLLGLTRYTSGFFNLAFGEENEEGVRMWKGKPKYSSLTEGPVKTPNPVGILVGSTILPPAKNINKLLGMVDKPPYKAENFTSGVPEFDAYVNENVTPLLDNKADRLLKNPVFQKAPQSKKIEMVDTTIRNARSELLSLLESRGGTQEELLVNERAKFMTRDRNARKRAMKELEITTPEHKLSRFQMEAIRRLIDLDKADTERSLR